MNDAQRSRLETWIRKVLPQVDSARSQTEHVDRLLGAPKGADLISLGLEAYRETVSILGGETKRVMTALVVPLSDVAALIPDAKVSDRILRDASREPPSIGLVSRETLKIPFQGEEYIVVARLKRLSVGDGSYCFYRVFRDLESVRRNWEYGRYVAVYHVG